MRIARNIEVIRLGRVAYQDAIQKMEERQRARTKGEVGDALFLLEHEPVITLGRRAEHANILESSDFLRENGVEIAETGRGGDVTYHGPGQIIGYPVLDLKPDRCDVRRYVHDLEEVMIRASEHFGVRAGRVENLIGSWVDEKRKIGAIGVRISRWVTSHGFAFNVTKEIHDGFRFIVPCGIRDKSVTSLSEEARQEISFSDAMAVVEKEFLAIFG